MMMEKTILKQENTVIRVLKLYQENALVINCNTNRMPYYTDINPLLEMAEITDEEMQRLTGIVPDAADSLTPTQTKIMNERFTLIAPIFPVLSDERARAIVINGIAKENQLCVQTVRKYLCLYLIYQTKTVLAIQRRTKEKVLSDDQKNMRWAINKYYYNRNKVPLTTCYLLMLKDKYTSAEGALKEQHPSLRQFQYFFNKIRKRETELISREGLSVYQRNHRPLLGSGIREFAPCVGYGMFDSTVADIYLVDDAGKLVGRPQITACVDAYSSICMGYALTWEGGVYALKVLLNNIVADKKTVCHRFGIEIDEQQWPVDSLPGVFVTDRGSEYVGSVFEQITELGVRVINLPPFRPDEKSAVEKFFDIIQSLFRDHLHGKGLVEQQNYQEKGAHDYRRDACLTLNDFEKILLLCINYYNSQRVLNGFFFSEAMINGCVKPYANEVYQFAKSHGEATLIETTAEQIQLVLLPRVQGMYCRDGLHVNSLRYVNPNHKEHYLNGGRCTVLFDPDNVSFVWVKEADDYIKCTIIDKEFDGASLAAVGTIKARQAKLCEAEREQNIQAKIELIDSIMHVVVDKDSHGRTKVNGIKSNRQKSIVQHHQRLVGEKNADKSNT